ncbi:uncharacterized protein LOC110814796 [Carica papaya]|uniref:uncharacterized protein LOC110814796 n=1 Tax=Carica papaya TaxID=3649 RepID=UPI000B8CBB02|nr:uncharacterized protein LOC110814796 [Carica papaya]
MDRKHVKYCVVDAFTDSPFKGNPAAVCLLEEDKDDEWLQSLAAEFNVSMTCYLTRTADSSTDTSNPRFRLRWFTPITEVDICGHATLASAHFLFSGGLVHSSTIEFETLSGILTAKKVQDGKAINFSQAQNGEAKKLSFLIELDFPIFPTTEFISSEVSTIARALNVASNSIVEIKKTTKLGTILVVLTSWKSVIELEPNFDEIMKCPGRGIIVSAEAPQDSEFDFCSRFFFPKYGIKEDPVCGSAHCSLTPYWSQKLKKFDFLAYAASSRSGVLNIHLNTDSQRVLLRGKAVVIMEGRILV